MRQHRRRPGARRLNINCGTRSRPSWGRTNTPEGGFFFPLLLCYSQASRRPLLPSFRPSVLPPSQTIGVTFAEQVQYIADGRAGYSLALRRGTATAKKKERTKRAIRIWNTSLANPSSSSSTSASTRSSSFAGRFGFWHVLVSNASSTSFSSSPAPPPRAGRGLKLLFFIVDAAGGV